MEYSECYCGDCCHLNPKRNKQGGITGEHICLKLDLLRSEWQPIEHCSYFINKASISDLYEACGYVLYQFKSGGINFATEREAVEIILTNIIAKVEGGK